LGKEKALDQVEAFIEHGHLSVNLAIDEEPVGRDPRERKQVRQPSRPGSSCHRMRAVTVWATAGERGWDLLTVFQSHAADISLDESSSPGGLDANSSRVYLGPWAYSLRSGTFPSGTA
jgi:hypothetical protein